MAATATRPRVALRVFVDEKDLGGSVCWHEITPGGDPTVRLRDVRDLMSAQTRRARLRAATARSGGCPGSMIVDLEVLIADTHNEAIRIVEAVRPPSPSGLRYIGTPRGLRSLLDDIMFAHVADGVTLIPLCEYNSLAYLVDTIGVWID